MESNPQSLHNGYSNVLVLSDLDGTMYTSSMLPAAVSLAGEMLSHGRVPREMLSAAMRVAAGGLKRNTGPESFNFRLWEHFRNEVLADEAMRERFVEYEKAHSKMMRGSKNFIDDITQSAGNVYRALVSFNLKSYVVARQKELEFDRALPETGNKGDAAIVLYDRFIRNSLSYSSFDAETLVLVLGNTLEDMLMGDKIFSHSRERNHQNVTVQRVLVRRNDEAGRQTYELKEAPKRSSGFEYMIRSA